MTIRTIDTADGYDRQLKRMFKTHYSKALHKNTVSALINDNRDILKALSNQ